MNSRQHPKQEVATGCALLLAVLCMPPKERKLQLASKRTERARTSESNRKGLE